MASSLFTADTAKICGLRRKNNEYLRIVMVGKTGCGKSATGNTILGRDFFESKLSATSVTVDCSVDRTEVDGQKVVVIDTPGLFDTRFDKDETDQHLSQCISLAAPGPHVFLVIISLVDRNREKEGQIVQKIQELFGEAAYKYSMVLFTHGDQLENTTIEEFLDGCPDLQELVAKCNGQYHVFNNKVKDRSQVIELLQKIKKICKKNTGSHYTNEMFQEAKRAVEEEKQRILRENKEKSYGVTSGNLTTNMASSSCTADTASNSGLSRINDKLLRIVLIGKTGCGKSATGNTILGRECFESKLGATSMTVDCSKGTTEVDGQKVAVTDTPGLFDTRFDKDETDQHLSQCITFAAPGPHVFLVIIRLVDRYTEEEKETVQRIQEIFGKAADKYSMVLFTHGDQLENTTIEEFLDGCPDLQELVARCNGKYHVFNNKVKDRSQVTELLQKIKEICRKNTGSHYTNEMFQQAERAVEQKKQRILRENKEHRQKEIEELEKKYDEKLKEEIKKLEEKLQIEKERLLREREIEILELKVDIKKEREEREKELREVREENKREIAKIKTQFEQKYKRELREEIERLQERYENEAREKAEQSNPFIFFRIACKRIGKVFKNLFF